MSPIAPIKVIGVPQNYAWGKIGSKSAVAHYQELNDSTFKINESEPYAELWMGTHPKAPATLKADPSEQLIKLISADTTDYLGSTVEAKFGSTGLPFLFKVLSINKVLSIQAHPDKTLAKQLHKDDPAHYPDDNHKPEMAVAITNFEAFCGFKPLKEVDANLQKIPEFHDLVGDEIATSFHEVVSDASATDADKKAALKSVFKKVMEASDATIEQYATKMVATTKSHPEYFGEEIADLIQRLDVQFPGDVGLFCGCLMLNHCYLNAGEAMFLKALEPHAYISGDIMECMATSDNVIRSGFTPKFKDVKTLVSCLTYSTNPVDEQKLEPAPFPRGSGAATFGLYDPPIDEFAVLQIKFSAKGGDAKLAAFNGPSMMIVTAGSGSVAVQGSSDEVQVAAEGNIFFVAPGTALDIVSSTSDFTLYRAFCEA